MASSLKSKEIKTCKSDCIEYIKGHCKLKMKDKKETEYSKVDKTVSCVWYREKK